MSLSVDIGLIVATLLSLRLMFFEKKISIFKTIILFIFSILFSRGIFSLGNDIYKIAFFPTYKARIVHVDKSENYDESGKYFMYRPTYTFNNGQKEINIKSPIGTSRRLIIGDTINIAYKNGEFLEYVVDTFVSFIGKLIGLLMSFLILFSIMATVLTKKSITRKYNSLIDDIIVLIFLLMFLSAFFPRVDLYSFLGKFQI